MSLRLLANGRNIFGCYTLRPFAHPVACCWMLLPVVEPSLKKTFQPTTPNISFVSWSPNRSATMLDPFAQLFQHCCSHARSLRMDYKDFWVVFFPRCTTGLKLVGRCCIRLYTTANTHTTTPNIVGATMLGDGAPVCTQPKNPESLSLKIKFKFKPPASRRLLFSKMNLWQENHSKLSFYSQNNT